MVDAVAAWSAGVRYLPELRFVNHYHDDRGYVQALARRVERYWREHGRGDHLVMSFHGVPERTLHLGDPYHCECHKTARLLADAAAAAKRPIHGHLPVALRQGEMAGALHRADPARAGPAGVARVDVVCPGFTGDCLETLEEIAQEGREAFLTAGGKDFHYIPCLNDEAAWIAALGNVAQQHLAGWPTGELPDPEALARSREAALAMGARGSGLGSGIADSARAAL